VGRNWFPLVFWGGALSVALLLGLTLEQFHRLPPEGDALQIFELERLASGVAAPADLPEIGWEAALLPEDWLQQGVSGTEIWYRKTLELDVPPNRLWATLLPGVNLAAAVYFNGELIGASERLLEPLSHDWNRPLMFTIPNGHLRPGDNVMHVRVVSYPSGHGFLAPIYVGPSELLRPSYERRSFVQLQVSRFVTIGTAFMSGLLGMIWWLRRSDTVYGWLALGTLMWSGHSLKYHISAIPVSSLQWAGFLFVTAVGFSIAVSLFMLRFTGARQPLFERVMLVYGAGAMVCLAVPAVLQWPVLYQVAPALVSVAIGLAVWNFGRMTLRLGRISDLDAYLVGAAVLVVLVVGLRDWVLILGFMDRSRGQYTQYAIPLLLAVLGLLLVRRFVQALRASERFTETLESSIAARTRELEQQHVRIRALERDRALAEERERLMRDMHDGAGGHLVSSLALLKAKGVDDPEITQVLSEALTDLRLMIDSLDPVDDDLNSVLGMLRDRMQSRLRSSGIETEWRLERLPGWNGLGPDQVLQILRILQEAITNVVKHAQASRLTVTAQFDDGAAAARICVVDNGHGFCGDAVGRGLRNMVTRAGRFGGTVQIDSGDWGSQVCLLVPCPAVGPAAPDRLR
jgi:signal transduction histidine kinase